MNYATDPELLKILIQTLRKLGQAGDPDSANRLAARAWSHLRKSDADAAEKINGTMHYLSRLPDPVQAAKNHHPTTTESEEEQ